MELVQYYYRLSTNIRFSDTHNRSQATHCKTVLGFKNIPDVVSWVCPNDAALLWNWCNIITYCQPSIRFSKTHPLLNCRHTIQVSDRKKSQIDVFQVYTQLLHNITTNTEPAISDGQVRFWTVVRTRTSQNRTWSSVLSSQKWLNRTSGPVQGSTTEAMVRTGSNRKCLEDKKMAED